VIQNIGGEDEKRDKEKGKHVKKRRKEKR